MKTSKKADARFKVLISIIDKIIESAPKEKEYAKYQIDPSNLEGLNSARARAFIHLFLKSEFGIENFEQIESHITDDTNDGGLDAYYINKDKRIIYLIQSKFRNVDFNGKGITFDELDKTEYKAIIRGNSRYKNIKGEDLTFNIKIRKFQEIISQTEYHDYDVEVILLANQPKENSDRAIKTLVGGYLYKFFDYERTYEKMVFSYCSGVNYSPEQITVTLSSEDREKLMIEQIVKTSIGNTEVRIFFVPVIQIAEIMAKFKNAILQNNPRNYLTLEKNDVNKGIASSLTDIQSNDFALLNNGLTILADGVFPDERKGKPGYKIEIINPQIINGAQTAYTLARIYSKKRTALNNKQVMVRLIKINSADGKDKFIEKLSDATNQQTKIIEADRRSNDPIQKKIQAEIFHHYGYLYSRKSGEFDSGLLNGSVEKTQIIKRDDLVKSYVAFSGRASEARRSSNLLFRAKDFEAIFKDNFKIERIFFSYLCWLQLNKIIKSKKIKNDFKYSRYAVICAVGYKKIDFSTDLEQVAYNEINEVMDAWKKFERFIKTNGKSHNKIYIVEKGIMDLDNYYKGKTVNTDIKDFFYKK